MDEFNPTRKRWEKYYSSYCAKRLLKIKEDHEPTQCYFVDAANWSEIKFDLMTLEV